MMSMLLHLLIFSVSLALNTIYLAQADSVSISCDSRTYKTNQTALCNVSVEYSCTNPTLNVDFGDGTSNSLALNSSNLLFHS